MDSRRSLVQKLRILAVGWVVLAVGAARLEAQVVKGSISGTVVDPTGAAIPGAQVEAKEAATGAVYRAVTDATGLFRLPLLGIGSYLVTVSKEGFRKLTLENVQVGSNQETNLGNITLEVGQVTTTVEVSAAPPLLHTTEAQVTNSLSSSTIEVLPGVGENEGLDNLAVLLPGIVATRDNNFSNTNGIGFSVNGLRGRNNDQQIDGQNNNDNSVAGPGLFLSNPDFVQEYQITTSNFGPEYGRNSGSVVNIVTKSGTNDWHGDVFGTESSWKLGTLSNTQKAFEGLKRLPKFNDEFSGVSAGGPIIKNKLFVFSGWDDQIIPGTTNYSTGNLTPTPAGLQQLAACFPNSASVADLQQFGPYGIKGGNPTPSGTPKTVTLAGPGGNPCNVQFAGVQRSLATPYKEYDFLARVDWQRDKDHVYGRYIRQTQNPENADPFGTAAAGYPANVPSFSEDIGLDWTRNLSASMVNEGRVSYGRLVVEFGGNGIGNTVPNQTNLASALTNVHMPSGYLDFGPATNAPQGRIVNTYQFQDNWTYFRGHHQIKAGTNITYQRSPNVFLPNYNGRFTFSSFENFALNVPRSISITLGSPNLDFREHDNFFYVGDDWKIKPHLTLNLGLTYSYFGQPANLFHQLDVKRESSSTPFFNPALPLSVRTFPDLPAPKNNWGPSAGFAYTPAWGGGKLVLRGGYRLTYDPAFYNIYLNIASAAPQVLAQTITGAGASSNPLPAQPFGPTVRRQLGPFLTLGVADPRSFNQTTVTPNFRGDRVHSWSFGVQRELTEHAVAEVRYVGNHGTDLFQSINGNPAIDGLAAAFPSLVPSGLTPCPAAQAVVPKAVGRVNCNLGVVRLRTNTGVSDYNGLQTELRATNLANQLTLRTSFTWSKTTDNVSEIFSTFAGGNTDAFSQNPLDYVHGEHGLSGLDIPKAWALSFYEDLPVFRGQAGVVGHLLGGWGLAGTYLIASGQPYSPAQFALNTSTGGSVYDFPFDSAFIGVFETARPFVGNAKAPVNPVGIYAGDACVGFGVGCGLSANTMLNFNLVNTTGATQILSPNGVRLIVNGATADSIYGTPWGSAGRNILRDYHTNIANFSIYKNIKISERFNLRFDVTALNVFNHPNFSSVDPFLDDAGLASENTGFATPSLFSGTTSTEGQRQIKFGLKLFF